MGTNGVSSLLTLSMNELIKTYSKKIDILETDCVHNGLLLTNIGDVLLRLRGDIKLIKLSYMSHQYDETFDLTISIHNLLCQLDEIIYPDLLEI